MKCTPSARLEQDFKDEQSPYAKEGTKAHQLAEQWLQYHLGERSDPPQGEPEMTDYVEVYVNAVLERITPGATVLLEQRLDFSPWVPEGFGTGDAVIIADGRLEIVDLKYGKGVPVSAEENPQLRLYALGAINDFDWLYDFDTVRMTIVQPRLDNISSEEMTVDELWQWGESIKPLAMRAFIGEGDFIPGEHCRFCKARYTCRARAEANLELARLDFREPETLTVEEIAEVLKQAEDLQRWVRDVKEYALNQAYRHGVKFPGWKVVEGRSVRKYTDEEAVARRLQEEGHDPYKKVLLTITELEKQLGRKRVGEVIGDLIEKPSGRPALVPETDKRPEILTAAAEDFKN
ncbi:DUF2800 domain-containing protein [Thermoactinomyces sp. CICC 23799]|nr:DUF2800 domain-containing protein [Thermoactinomyces sp. CICC 23799]